MIFIIGANEFVSQSQQVLFWETRARINSQKSLDFKENYRLGKDTRLSRMFQVMGRFQLNRLSESSALRVMVKNLITSKSEIKSARS